MTNRVELTIKDRGHPERSGFPDKAMCRSPRLAQPRPSALRLSLASAERPSAPTKIYGSERTWNFRQIQWPDWRGRSHAPGFVRESKRLRVSVDATTFRAALKVTPCRGCKKISERSQERLLNQQNDAKRGQKAKARTISSEPFVDPTLEAGTAIAANSSGTTKRG